MRRLITVIFLLSTALYVNGQDKYGYINLEDESHFEFEVFGDTLDDYQVYFTGENHMYASFNTDFQYKLLTFLHQTQNVQHFIFEQSPAVGYIIEQVIIENKSSHLHYLKDMFYSPFYSLVKRLRKYNDTLANQDKIHIHGIDVERFPYFSLYALDKIIHNLDDDGDGGEVFEQIHALATSDFELAGATEFYGGGEDRFGFTFGEVSAWESMKSIIEIAEKNKDSLTVVLEENAGIFYSILKSLELGRDWYISEKKGDVRSPIIRERFMSDEFERVYRNNPDSKYYGQFGRCHLHKDQDAGRCYDYYMNSIANRIKDLDSSLSNKVLVIPIYYSHSKEFDYKIIKDLQLKDKFMEENQSYIIDLAYKNGDHPIVGFYDELPFIVICNESQDGFGEHNFSWNSSIEEYHLGFYYGYRYFNGVKKLNNELVSVGVNKFTNKVLAYTFAFDYFTVNNIGNRFSYTYYNSISNNDRFKLNGYLMTIGNYYAVGNKYLLASFGMDWGYGQMSLTEETDNAVPNLIQQNGQNINIYKNDVFVVDPNIELRLTLPIISLNFKAGYALDISGKYWKLNGKMKDFTKTGFSAPYIQAGISLNYKVIK